MKTKTIQEMAGLEVAWNLGYFAGYEGLDEDNPYDPEKESECHKAWEQGKSDGWLDFN